MKVIVNRKQYDKLINESRGYSSMLEKWADYVTDELLSLILKQDVEEDVYLLTKLSLKLNGKDFYEELPIDSVILSVTLKDSIDEDASVDMAYVPRWTQIVEDEDGKYHIYDVEVEVEMVLPKNRGEINFSTLQYYFSSYLSHEFMHVYEWVNRGLENPKELTGCESVYTEGTIYGDAVDRIGYLLYVALSYEKNAFVQQTGTMISKRKPENKQQFMDYLKSNPIYHFVEEMIKYDPKLYLEEIDKLSSDRKNQLKKIMACFYSNGGKIPKIKDTNIFLMDIDRKFKITGEYLKKKLLGLITVV
jgi:hypothetical protein